MITCAFEQSIVVTDSCTTLTANDWLNNPGNCRLRVKNYNPADWAAGGCGTCTNAGGVNWDGTFPVFIAGTGYFIDPGTGNVGGKQPFFGGPAFPNLSVFGGQWVINMACAPTSAFIWGGFGPVFAAGPIGIYNQNVGCVVTPSFQIEAYSL